MATVDQVEAAVTRIFVALNACDKIGVDYVAVVSHWATEKALGRSLTEEGMKEFSLTVANTFPATGE